MPYIDAQNIAKSVKRIKNKTNTAKIRGKTVTKKQNSDLILLNKAYKSLANRGYMRKQSTTTTNNELALTILDSIGCSIVDAPADMSLLPEQTDTESIDNENIIDSKKLSNIKNKKSVPSDKYPNVDDAFYTLDPTPARTIQQQMSRRSYSRTNVEKIAAQVYSLNYSSAATTIKEFL